MAPPVREATVAPLDVNRLASADRKRLFRGLERFVNAADSLEEYKALAKGWPGFWPLDLQDGQANSLAWDNACHGLFLAHRDALRRVWISDPVALHGGMLGFLLGLSGVNISLPDETGLTLKMALDKIQMAHPGASEVSRPVVWPSWKSGDFSYSPDNEFRWAVYQLMRESWRAKICAKCSTYFVASKPAQLYCSTACSGGVKRERTLKWWRTVGTKRRATRTKKNRQKDTASRGRR